MSILQLSKLRRIFKTKNMSLPSAFISKKKSFLCQSWIKKFSNFDQLSSWIFFCCLKKKIPMKTFSSLNRLFLRLWGTKKKKKKPQQFVLNFMWPFWQRQKLSMLFMAMKFNVDRENETLKRKFHLQKCLLNKIVIFFVKIAMKL